jgi:hypothetical protein
MKSLHFGQMVSLSSVTRFYQSGEFHKVEQILIDAGLNENQIRMSFELKLQLTGTTKTVLLWNVIS